jgi:hypothetical protein
MKVYNDIAMYKGSQMKSLVLNALNQLGNYYVKSYPSKALEYYLKAEEYMRLNKLVLADDMLSKLYLNIGRLLLQR